MSGSICPNIDIFDRSMSANQCISRAHLKYIVKDESNSKDEDVRRWPSKILFPHFLVADERFDGCTSVAARNCQISSLHPCSQISAASLPHLSTVPELEESLFSQLFSGDFSLPGSPSALNPNKAILTVDHKTREVMCAHWEELDLQYSSKSIPCKCVLSDFFRFCQQMNRPANCLSAPPVT